MSGIITDSHSNLVCRYDAAPFSCAARSCLLAFFAALAAAALAFFASARATWEVDQQLRTGREVRYMTNFFLFLLPLRLLFGFLFVFLLFGLLVHWDTALGLLFRFPSLLLFLLDPFDPRVHTECQVDEST